MCVMQIQFVIYKFVDFMKLFDTVVYPSNYE